MANRAADLFLTSKELMSKFTLSIGKETKTILEKNKDSNVIKFLNDGVKKFQAVLKTIDKILKQKNIDLEKLVNTGKNKFKEGIETVKSLKTKKGRSSILGKIKSTANGIKSKLTSRFKGENKTTKGPPDEEDSEEDSEGKQSWLSKLTQRQKKREKEVEEEKKAVLEAGKGKKKKDDSWLGKIISSIANLGGFLVKGFGRITKRLGGYLVKGLGRLLASFVPGASGIIARGTSGLLRTAGRLGGRALGSIGRAVFSRGTLSLLGRAAMFAGRGAAMLATGPIGWAVAAGTAIYAGYKLYKYFKRNDISNDIYGQMMRLRFMMYGYDDSKKEHYHKLTELDMMMKDRVKYNNYQITIDEVDQDFHDKLLELFEVNPEDKEKYETLKTWFTRRYLPSFKAFLHAVYAVNNSIYLDDLDKFKASEIAEIIGKLNVPPMIYNVKYAPYFQDPLIKVSPDQIDALKAAIAKEAKDKVLTSDGSELSLAKGVKFKADNKASNTASRLANKIQKSDNLAVKIFRWTPIGMTTLAYLKLSSAIKNKMDIYAQLTLLRFMMYGFDENLLEHFDKLATLELNMQKYLTYNQKTKAVGLKNLSTKDINDLATIFGIIPEKKYDMEIFVNWLNKRFAPAYLAYMQALYSTNPKVKLEEIEKLKFPEIVDFINKLNIPGNIFNVVMLPTSKYDNSKITKEDVEDKKQSILRYAKFLSIGTSIKKGVTAIGSWIGDKLSSIGKSISETAGKVGGYIKDKASKAGKWLVKNLINPIAEMAGKIGKFSMMLFTSDFEGEKIMKLMNIPIMKSFIQLRYMMYGFGPGRQPFYIKLANLEMLMSNYITINDDGLSVQDLDVAAKSKIFDIFGVNKDNDDQITLLNIWFNNRFLPAYAAFMKALFLANKSAKLTNMNTLSFKELYTLISKLMLPNKIFGVTNVPDFTDPKTYITKEDINSFATKILNYLKSIVDKGQATGNNTLPDVKPTTQKVEQQAVKQQVGNTPNTDTTPKVQQPRPEDLKAPDIDIEDKPRVSQDASGGAGSSSSSQKLNVAPGTLAPGSLSLEGIKPLLPKEKIYNLDPNVRELFTGMAKEYHSLTGKVIPVTEAFRSREDQERMFKKYPGKAARPGTSTHEFGLAIDIDSPVADELDKLGLLRKYGFTRPIGGEKWHLEPIGVSIDPNLAKKDPNFRMKAILASPGRGGGGYGLVSNARMKGRDIPLQKQIYASTGGTPVDITKYAANSVGGELAPNPPVETASTRSKTETTSYNYSSSVATTSTTVTNANTKPVDVDIESKPKVPSSGTDLASKTSSVPSTSGNVDLTKYTSVGPVEAIKQASKMTGVSEDVLMSFAKVESSLGKNTVSKTSGARGLFQIVPNTWNALVSKYGKKYGLPPDASPDNHMYNALMAAEYIKENMKSLPDYKSAGMNDATAAYLAHHFGPTGAKKMINAYKEDPNKLVKDIVSESAYKANKNELGTYTLATYVQNVNSKLGVSGGPVGVPSTSQPTYQYASQTTSQTSDPKWTTGNLVLKSAAQQAPVSTTLASNIGYSPASYTKEPDIPKPQPNPAISSASNMESLMRDQLTSLKQIVTILSSINDKVDVTKLKDALNNTGSKQQTIDRSIPNSSVDLTKRKLSV